LISTHPHFSPLLFPMALSAAQIASTPMVSCSKCTVHFYAMARPISVFVCGKWYCSAACVPREIWAKNTKLYPLPPSADAPLPLPGLPSPAPAASSALVRPRTYPLESFYEKDYSGVDPNLDNWNHRLLQVDALAQDIFDKMRLTGWKATSVRGKRQYVQLNRALKQIRLSANYLARVPLSMIENTILHFAILARMEPGTKKNSVEVLRECARWVCKPGLECPHFYPHQWLFRCSRGCWQVKRHQRNFRKAKNTCKKCGAKCEYVATGTPIAKSTDGNKAIVVKKSARKPRNDEEDSDEDGERAAALALAYGKESEEEEDDDGSDADEVLVIPAHFRGKGSAASAQQPVMETVN